MKTRFILAFLAFAVVQSSPAIVLTTNNPIGMPRYVHTTTLLLNGKVLVTGGITTGSVTTNSCELYDPATGTWTNTGPLNLARNQHTATLLLNGKVLVAGGSAVTGVTNTCELYDPATGTWSFTGSLNTGRNQHTATLLPNGKVLVAGGVSLAAYQNTAELYDPSTGIWMATNSMITARASHTATLLTNGTVLVAGGYNGTHQSAAEIFNPANNTWTATTGGMTAARFRHSATLLPNGKVLISSGGNSGGWLTSSELFNPATGTFANSGTLNSAHANSSAVLLPNGKVLVAGGYNGGPVSVAETFDPANGTWTTTTSLAVARYNNTLTLLANGKVLVVAGFVSAPVNTTELYDLTGGAWTSTGSMNSARDVAAAAMLPNGKILIAGGLIGAYTESAEIFDPSNGVWTMTGSMSSKRSQHTVTLLPNGKVLVAGGYLGVSGNLVTNGVELFDYSAGTWTIASPMNTGRYLHTATALADGRVLVAGGFDPSLNLANAEIYYPATGGWTNTSSMNFMRARHSATLLPGGKILVAGGFGPAGLTATVEFFDPTTGVWTTTGSMSIGRQYHTATLLPNGKVLVAGGATTTTGNMTNSCELYNPATGTWTNTGSMIAARFQHAATLLPNGKVLATGGYTNYNFNTSSGTTMANCEVYDPALGTWSSVGALTNARVRQIAALLPNGKILVTGGANTAGSSLGSAELFDPGLGFTNIWQPQITNFTSPVTLGSNLVLAGSQFRGISEGGGGNMQDSSGDCPVVQLRSLENGQILSLTSTNWNTNSFTSQVITNFPVGYALVTMFVNGIPSTSAILSIAKPVASVTITNLAQTYDGTARSVGATTSPPGLAVNFTYNGSFSAPTNAGSYTVVAFINDPNYQGTATNTLVVSQTIATVTLSNLSQIYDGAPKAVTATTSPTNLTVIVTYNGSTNAPTAVGSYIVTGLISDVNYYGGATNTFVINCPVIVVTPSSLPGAKLNSNYSQTISASGGSLPPYVFTVTSGALPAGLMLSTNGLLSGTPTAFGNFNFTVTATDGAGCADGTNYILAVNGAPSIIMGPMSQAVLTGGTISLSVTASGSGLAYQWQLNGTNISGANSSMLVLNNASVTNSGHYTVVVSNAGGPVTSDAAIVTVWSMNFYPVVTVTGEAGDQYRVDYTEDLSSSNWTVLQTITLPFSPYFVVDTNSPNSNQRFYRVVLP